MRRGAGGFLEDRDPACWSLRGCVIPEPKPKVDPVLILQPGGEARLLAVLPPLPWVWVGGAVGTHPASLDLLYPLGLPVGPPPPPPRAPRPSSLGFPNHTG